MDTQDRIKQFIKTSSHNGAALVERLAVVAQNYPEAMVADTIYTLDITGEDQRAVEHLINTLINNRMAVERRSMRAGKITHLDIWPRQTESACSKQLAFVMGQLAGDFPFVDGWKWAGDVRDQIFELPRRFEDQCTWLVGTRYGIEDGGPHGIWNRSTFAVRFAAPDSTEVVDIGIYIRNGDKVMKLSPGRSFEEVTGEHPPLF